MKLCVEIIKTKKAGFVEYKSSCVLDPYCQGFFFFFWSDLSCVPLTEKARRERERESATEGERERRVTALELIIILNKS